MDPNGWGMAMQLSELPSRVLRCRVLSPQRRCAGGKTWAGAGNWWWWMMVENYKLVIDKWSVCFVDVLLVKRKICHRCFACWYSGWEAEQTVTHRSLIWRSVGCGRWDFWNHRDWTIMQKTVIEHRATLKHQPWSSIDVAPTIDDGYPWWNTHVRWCSESGLSPEG